MTTRHSLPLWALLIFCPLFLLAQSKTDLEVLATEQARFECMTRADTAALRPMLADDLLYVHSNTLKENKLEHLEAIAAKRLVYREMAREEVRVRRFGRTALTNGTLGVKGELKGAAFDVRLFYTAVYRKKRGVWQLVNWQSTRVP
jgi:ketosteroid isomerase-like protein